jgi:hypothetical protein
MNSVRVAILSNETYKECVTKLTQQCKRRMLVINKGIHPLVGAATDQAPNYVARVWCGHALFRPELLRLLYA